MNENIEHTIDAAVGAAMVILEDEFPGGDNGGISSLFCNELEIFIRKNLIKHNLIKVN